MLEALKQGKLPLSRPGFEVEDILTSVVFGCCKYLDPQRALFPFLGRAETLEGRILARDLAGYSSVSYTFWPSWAARLDRDGQVLVGSEPELVLELDGEGCQPALILIEGKLFSGKSSLPSAESEPVNDQLGKYWRHLAERAHHASRHPLAVIYVTDHPHLPHADFEETQGELLRKVGTLAPLFWLSWRSFVPAVGETDGAMLTDVVALLRDRWELMPIEVRPWPLPRVGAGWEFRQAYNWTLPPTAPVCWHYNNTFTWSVPPGLRPWTFQSEKNDG